MNANELADLIDSEDTLWLEGRLSDIATMLRQQQEKLTKYELRHAEQRKRIEELESEIEASKAKTLTDEEIQPLLDRIQNYLELGGLFNPECMEHEKVRDLIMDCKAILRKAQKK